MSKTYKDRGWRRRIVKNSLYKKELHIWGEDFSGKRKDREINRRLRAKQKREVQHEQRIIYSQTKS